MGLGVCASRGHPWSSHLPRPPPSSALCPGQGAPQQPWVGLGLGAHGVRTLQVAAGRLREQACGGGREGVWILYMREDTQPLYLQPTRRHGDVGPSGYRRDPVTLLLGR